MSSLGDKIDSTEEVLVVENDLVGSHIEPEIDGHSKNGEANTIVEGEVPRMSGESHEEGDSPVEKEVLSASCWVDSPVEKEVLETSCWADILVESEVLHTSYRCVEDGPIDSHTDPEIGAY